MKEFNLFQTIEDLLNQKCLCQDPSCNVIFTFENYSGYKYYWFNCKQNITQSLKIEFQNDNEICIFYSLVNGHFILKHNQLYYFIDFGFYQHKLNLNLKCSENQLNLIHKLIQKQEIKLIFS